MASSIRLENLTKIFDAPPLKSYRITGGIAPRRLSRAYWKDRREARKQQKTKIVALDGISLEIPAGEVFGMLGPNGAGKSTAIGVLTTRTRPTSGRAFVGDIDVWQRQVQAKRLIGVVPQKPNPDFALTVREILLFHGAYFGQGRAEREKRADELLERFAIADRADFIIHGLSGGMLQRLSIARALMHDPEVLFLDEPSVGLDPHGRRTLWEFVREYNRRGKTIVLTTHYMEEADALCGRVAIIDHGRIIAAGTPSELKSSIPGGYLMRLRFDRTPEEILSALRLLPGVREVRQEDEGGLDIYADKGGALIPAVVNAAQAAGLEIRDVRLQEPSLENLFLHHTGRSLHD